MKVRVKEIIKLIRDIASNVSIAVSLLAIVMTLTVSYEVFARYVLGHPTSWVWPINKQLFGVFILTALAYTESQDGHIRIELFYDRFPKKFKKFSDWLTFASKMVFMGVLTWQTAIMAKHAILYKERASGAFKIPLYPFKGLIFLISLVITCEILFFFVSENVFNKKADNK